MNNAHTVHPMTQGPLSPDGRHQLQDGEWVRVPKPPTDWWQVFCMALLVVVALIAVLVVIALTVDA